MRQKAFDTLIAALKHGKHDQKTHGRRGGGARTQAKAASSVAAMALDDAEFAQDLVESHLNGLSTQKLRKDYGAMLDEQDRPTRSNILGVIEENWKDVWRDERLIREAAQSAVRDMPKDELATWIG